MPAARPLTPFPSESTMPLPRLILRTGRQAISALVIAGALLLTTLATAPAHAESGAHRNPPAPPVHTPIVVAERD